MPSFRTFLCSRDVHAAFVFSCVTHGCSSSVLVCACMCVLCSSAVQLRELLTSLGLTRVDRIHLGFCCGYDMSSLIDAVHDLLILVALTVMTEPTAELLHMLSACPQVTLLPLQGSFLSCHTFRDISKRLQARLQLARNFLIRVEQVTRELHRRGD